jgi:tRNA(fMet)-specific endonuclease VapC
MNDLIAGYIPLMFDNMPAVLIEVLPLEVPADAEYGGIRSELEAAGKPIGGNDLLIAAHAYATGATIVTANSGEFKRIRGLNVENWLA